MFKANPRYASPWPCLTLLTAYTAAGLLGAFAAPQKVASSPSAAQVLFAIFFPFVILTLASWLTFFWAGIRQRNLHLSEDQEPARESAPAKYGFWKAFGIGAGVMAAFLPVVGLLSMGVELLLSWLGVDAPPQDAVKWLMSPEIPMSVKLILVGGVVLVAPLNEELFFRFTLYRVLDCRLKGRLTATLAVAALFAGIHLNIIAYVPVFCLSVIFSELMRRTGRFAAPFAAHMVFNAASVIVALLSASL